MIQDMLPTYTLANGLRRVLPYYFNHRTPFKQRWLGKTVVEVLVSELGQSAELVERGVSAGTIFLSENNGRAGGPMIIRGKEVMNRHLVPHDVIHNAQHVHEPAVPWQPNKDSESVVSSSYDGEKQTISYMKNGLPILYQNNDMVVVSKPAGVPTHPSGIYRYNTLLEILSHELGVPVWPCHRLDKSTLGIVVFAKTKLFCKDMMKVFATHTNLEKVYIARVKGKFTGSCIYRSPLVSINSSGSGYVNVPEQVPVSTTHFEGLTYISKTDESIVVCKPVTGKMHQIRIHLSLLGHPISNDQYYNGTDNLNHRKHAVEREIYNQIFEKFPQFGRSTPTERFEGPSLISVADFVNSERKLQIAAIASSRRTNDQGLITGKCPDCLAPLYSENPDLGIYLHALSLTYSFPQIIDSDIKRLQVINEAVLQTKINLFGFFNEYPKWCVLQISRLSTTD